MSEQSRVSFYAEGIKVDRDDWNRVFKEARKRRTRLATTKG
ncbi:MAG: hypothetical protein U5L11_03600 [Arhodomonas sp.]|nr:hypothetical protein [Arhodomonas sp.]